MNVQEFLNARGKPYEVLSHPTTFSATEMAQAVHVPGREVAKSVVMNADGRYVLAVVPSTRRVVLDKVMTVLGAKSVELADEGDLPQLFPDCELGAMPPFGSQFGLSTIVDPMLTRDDEIVFEGNTLRESIRMKYRDFEAIEHPVVADVSAGL